MPDTEQREHRQELLDRCFEVFKHLTTLSTASALLILAIYREQPFRLSLLALTLVIMGVCLVVSVYGMLVIAVDPSARSQSMGERARGIMSEQARDVMYVWLSTLSASLFIAAVTTLALTLLGVPTRTQVVSLAALAAAVVAIVLVRHEINKRR